MKITNKSFKKIGLVCLIIGLVWIFGIFKSIFIDDDNSLDEKDVAEYLEDKYDEEFDDIIFLESVKNPDQVLSCDGSTFGTIKGKGATEYYKVYSKKNNMEFFAFYDTSDRERKIEDTYDLYLSRRKVFLKAYDVANEYLSTSIDSIYFYTRSYDEKIYLNSKSVLYNELSSYDDMNNNDYNYNFIVVIDDDIFDFSKKNYEIIDALNDRVEILMEESCFVMFIVFNDGAKIQLNRLDGEAYVYDEFKTNGAWGEKLENFVLREDY